MNKRIQTKMVAEALSQHTHDTRSKAKKMISVLMSVCSSLAKPPNDLGLEQWKHIEFKKSKFNKNLDQHDLRSL